MNLETSVWGVRMDNPLCNASGPICTTLKELEWLQMSAAGSYIMKSCTLEEREWNPEPRYVDLEFGSINSMWLPNLWYKQYIEFSQELKRGSDKPLLASVAGLSPNHFPIMVQAMQDESEVDLIEVNLSCPNVIGKPQIAYDFDAADEILWKVEKLGSKKIGVKLPPYFDPVHSEQMAKVLLKHDVSFITCINSVWNTLFIDPEKEQVVIKPKGGFGWLWGDYVKPVALANVRKFYELLGDKIDIVWVWGIKSWVDVFEFILAGASAVQLGTVYAQQWTECFERILEEFKEYASDKWYGCIDDIKGKLKTL